VIWVLLGVCGILSLIAWLAILLHPARPWDFQPVGEDEPAPPAPADWPDVTAIVPARNEARMLPRTLPALLKQDYPGRFHVVLVDDRSEDGAAEAARQAAEACGAGARLTVVRGAPLPEGWVGKAWALHQAVMKCGLRIADCGLTGRARSVPANPQSAIHNPQYLWLTDADILHAPGSLRRLVAESERDGLALNSRMARLRCVSPAEKLLIPPFVFFFNLLYPMRRVNDPANSAAAAAGGCILLDAEALAQAGGFGAIRGEVIDDVNLAWRIKGLGRPIRLSLSRRDIVSLRAYGSLGAVWKMVRRSAFTELKHSWARLAGTLLGLALLFLAPPLCFLGGAAGLSLSAAGMASVPTAWVALTAAAGLAAWAVMARIYLPATLFFGLSRWRACTPPLAGVLYGAMAADSARVHLCRSGGA
jgi:hopene-associated glycosyltransferase HpnB